MGSQLLWQRALRARVKRFAARSLGNRQLVRRRLSELDKRAIEYSYFGGVVRDIALFGSTKNPRDIDLVVRDDQFDVALETFADCSINRNRFGGVRIVELDWSYDLWPLSATWAFKRQYVKEPAFDRLPLTTFLNLEAIVIRCSPGRNGYVRRDVFENGFRSAISSRTLEVNLVENPFPFSCAARAMVIAGTQQMRLGRTLVEYLSCFSVGDHVDEIHRALTGHYRSLRISKDQLRAILRDVLSWRRAFPRLPMGPPPEMWFMQHHNYSLEYERVIGLVDACNRQVESVSSEAWEGSDPWDPWAYDGGFG